MVKKQLYLMAKRNKKLYLMVKELYMMVKQKKLKFVLNKLYLMVKNTVFDGKKVAFDD